MLRYNSYNTSLNTLVDFTLVNFYIYCKNQIPEAPGLNQVSDMDRSKRRCRLVSIAGQILGFDSLDICYEKIFLLLYLV